MARVSRKAKAANAPAQNTAVRIWKAALYARLSVEDNGKDSDSIENQLAYMEEFIGSRPYLQKAAVFADNGYTGTDFLRPEFTRMMEAVQNGLVDCVIVKDLSRLGRNYIETSQFVEKLCPFYGLRFIAISDNYDTATVTSEDQLSASLTNIVNDYYAKDISRKVRSALQSKMERGDYIGNYAPHGYIKDPDNKNHLLVCPETAPVIRRIFEMRASGMTYGTINRRLNAEGVISPSQYKKEHGVKTNNNQKDRVILWNKHMLTEILSNVVYIGHLAQRRTTQCLYAGIPFGQADEADWIVAKKTHEPIISEELFEAVQEINRATAQTQKANSGKYDHLPKRENIYSGKFFCESCGAKMKLVRSFNRDKTKAYFTFKCPTYAEHGSKGCTDVKIRMEDLDTTVLAFIKSQMGLFVSMEDTLRVLLAMKKSKLKQNRIPDEIRSVRQKLSNKKSLLGNLYVDLKDGLLSQEEYSNHREIISSDIEALQIRLSELEATQEDTEAKITGEMKWKRLVRKYGDAKELNAEMVTAFVERIQIRSDSSLDINLNYMDEFETLLSKNQKLRKEVA